MIRGLLNRWAAKRLASIQDGNRQAERNRIKAKAQSMRLAMGMQAHPALSTREN